MWQNLALLTKKNGGTQTHLSLEFLGVSQFKNLLISLYSPYIPGKKYRFKDCRWTCSKKQFFLDPISVSAPPSSGTGNWYSPFLLSLTHLASSLFFFPGWSCVIRLYNHHTRTFSPLLLSTLCSLSPVYHLHGTLFLLFMVFPPLQMLEIQRWEVLLAQPREDLLGGKTKTLP